MLIAGPLPAVASADLIVITTNKHHRHRNNRVAVINEDGSRLHLAVTARALYTTTASAIGIASTIAAITSSSPRARSNAASTGVT
ncbi:hypothetical protein [Mesorhizobium sp. CO1-1-8]|uniref:hypothetical protein n=1 Tax=Mesorhizobium sp. CO1-1-8 TaxID=2876631 RepID=UPI001CD153E5|nr:hypothetical protein [Mesorhizobium sp. CO1-1-8]MBZ9775218.1 hypothetical protein [Mesorhizobium sp. CO1-1-8]